MGEVSTPKTLRILCRDFPILAVEGVFHLVLGVHRASPVQVHLLCRCSHAPELQNWCVLRQWPQLSAVHSASCMSHYLFETYD